MAKENTTPPKVVVTKGIQYHQTIRDNHGTPPSPSNDGNTGEAPANN